MPKQYALITGEPLTDFEESILRMLHEVAETGHTPTALVGVVLTDAGEVMTCYHNADLKDLIVAKGFVELDIVNENILGNLPWFVEQARKDGLIEDWDEDEEEGEE
jgi:hypothetical protein